ncbi:MAG: hypothetical protein GX410_01850 [Elusimicrobia bacterium]|nr:hypothetical protein [Elusimicrobiota bacterium]
MSPRTAPLALALALLAAADAAALDRDAFPPVLGGVVRSKKWVVRRDSKQEEFIGDVSYRNPAYFLKSDWALDDKKKEEIFLKGSVYINARRQNGSVLETYCDRAEYSKLSGLARFFSGNDPVRLLYTSSDGAMKMNTLSDTALVDEKKSYMKLTGTVKGVINRADGSVTNTFSDQAEYSDISGDGMFSMNAPGDRVKITHSDPQKGSILALSRQADFKSKQETATFTGDSDITAEKMRARSDNAVYDFKTTVLDLSGGRPVVAGERNGYDFAMQADFISINRSSETMKAGGKVRGWTRKQEPFAPPAGKK